jgi:hypothetical protein
MNNKDIGIGLVIGVIIGTLLTFGAFSISLPEKKVGKEPHLLSVGAILPDQNGKHFAARTTLDRSLNYGNALEVYVRSQDDGSPMWGYVHIKDYASQLRWKTIEGKFRVVGSGNFADITYRDQFGYILDQKQGFFKSTEGFTPGLNHLSEYWVVIWLTPDYEG